MNYLGNSQPNPRVRLAYLYLAGVMLAYALVILFASAPPPFVDYPDWVYQGVLFHGVLTGHPVLGYAMKHYPVPNSTTTVGIGVLNVLMPWQWAAKSWMCIYLFLAAFATWMLAQAMGKHHWRLVVAVPAITFLNLNFWYGHISFELGICLVMLLLSMLIRNASGFAITGMLVAIFFTHMEACAGALLLTSIWYVSAGQWRRLWSLGPTIALTAWYTIARFKGGNIDIMGLPAASYRYGSPPFLVYKINTFFKSFGYVNAETLKGLSLSERIFGRSLLVLLICASLCLASLCLLSIMRRTHCVSGRLRLFVFTLLAISLLLPQELLGTFDPGSRLLVMAFAVGLFLIDWARSEGLMIACLSVLFCLINLLQFFYIEQNPRMEGRSKDLPAPLIHYGHVEPETRLKYYDHLRQGKMDQHIFATALFYEEKK